MALLFSMLSITAGVLSLTVVIGVMNGLQDILIKNLIRIESYEYSGTAKHALSLSGVRAKTEEIQRLSDIEVVVPFVDEFALISHNKISVLAHVRAVLSEAAYNDTEFMSAMRSGVSHSEKAVGFVQRGSIRLGWVLASRLGLYRNDVLQLTLPGSGVGFAPSTHTLVVSDIFFTASSYDNTWAFISLADYAEDMSVNASRTAASSSSIVRTQPIQDPKLTGLRFGLRFARRIENRTATLQTLQAFLKNVRPWQENNRSFYFALKTEKTLLALLTAIIFAVIALHFYFAMLRRINGKRDDIVSLRTMGATPQNICIWFLGEGICVGGIGIVMGLALGLSIFAVYPHLAGLLQNGAGAMPVLINTELGFVSLSEIAMITLSAAVIILISTYCAARRVTKITPMQTLHYD